MNNSLQELIEVSDKQSIGILNNPFNNEKEFCDYIEINISIFLKTCLNLEYKSHTREQLLGVKSRIRQKGSKRLDFFVLTACGKEIVIECKNPKYITDSSYAIGQVLEYGATIAKYRRHPDMLVLLSTRMEPTICNTIRQYNLPILYIAMDKENYLFSNIEHLS